MKSILGPAQRRLLAQFAWSNVLCAFDFDGTLAPIVSTPGEARLPASTRRLLHEVASLYPCAVISGRARRDVASRLTGLPLFEVVGNHGLEPTRGARVFELVVARWVPRLRRLLEPHRGVVVEDKRLSVAIHYRKSREKKRAQQAIRAAVAGLGPLRAVPGKQVLNLLPAGAPHKGLALEAVRARAGCDTALYVGDDDTDEDVFALDQPGRLLAIRVGRRPGSLAPYYLRRRGDIDALLRLLRDVGRQSRRQLRRAVAC
jgi:trehalose 6-phosphate phosphatase